MTFKECKDQVNQKENLESLFELWRKAHGVEIDENFGQQNISKEKFEKDIYNKKGNTISSHFTQFFEKECSKCQKARNIEKNVWEIALKKAFNMDGTYENFKIKEGGYRYICLLKEANDSKKMCVNDYLFETNIVNEWVVEDSKETCGRKYRSHMLDKLNTAFALYSNQKQENFDFRSEMAFMNINKRGGTSTTAGRDETAVVNYAKEYRKFILKEIDILREHNDVTIFVCGSESYFKRLMIALFPEEKEKIKNHKENIYLKGKIKFIKISHPSYWKVSPEQLAQEMQGEIRK